MLAGMGSKLFPGAAGGCGTQLGGGVDSTHRRQSYLRWGNCCIYHPGVMLGGVFSVRYTWTHTAWIRGFILDTIHVHLRSSLMYIHTYVVFVHGNTNSKASFDALALGSVTAGCRRFRQSVHARGYLLPLSVFRYTG